MIIYNFRMRFFPINELKINLFGLNLEVKIIFYQLIYCKMSRFRKIRGWISRAGWGCDRSLVGCRGVIVFVINYDFCQQVTSQI